MVVTDPIGDFLTRIRNAVLARKQELSLPYSRMKEEIAQVLAREGYLAQVKKEDNQLRVTLSYRGRQPRITGVKNISKPGLRIYKKARELKKRSGVGIRIVSTPQGVMTGKEAAKRQVGGEVLAQVW